MHDPGTPLLEFDRVGGGPGMARLTLSLQAGELAMLPVGPEVEWPQIVDWITGVARPAAGTVRYRGGDWALASGGEQFARRASIGVASPGVGWLSNLDVSENVTLAQRHHTRKPPAEILSEADRWSRAFGLDGLPHGRPAEIGAWTLRRAACVRAFVGRPDLVVLDRPTDPDHQHGSWSALVKPLLDAVAFARGRGAGIVWVTGDRAVLEHCDLRPTHRIEPRV